MQNKIFPIKNAREEWVETKEGIETSLNHYFTKIMFEPRQDMSDDINQITHFISSLVTQEQNYLLMKPITLLEVEEVVVYMKEGTTPGPNGLTINFFLQLWDLIKMEVWRIVEDSRVSKRALPTFNATFITLIPKCEGADSPDKFRPISLCNVIYNIITKVIANRLNPSSWD